MDIPFLPLELSKNVIDWVYEFIRLDTTERVNTGRTTYGDMLRHVHEDIRSNVPVYTFHILTQNQHYLTLSLSLPACDPDKVRTDLRVPESHISTWVRRTIATASNRRGIYVIYSE